MPEPDDVPLVFIHGLMGSVLVDEFEKVRWLAVSEALNLSTPELSLPETWDGVKQGKDRLSPAGVLMRVDLIPHVLGERVYAPWISYASKIRHRPLHIFSYDWRRDNAESAELFEKFLDEIYLRYGKKRIQIVAHSMGGMITLAVWNRRPELIDRVVFAGVPFRGGVGYLEKMMIGVPISLNKSLLTPHVLFTHTSVYSFYPAGQSFESTDVIEDESGKPLAINFYDPEAWRKNGFGPFARENSEWAGSANPTFLSHALQRCLVFRKQMLPRSEVRYHEALVITSKSFPTLARARRVQTADSIPRWDFKTTREPGDGSVLYRHALPPEPIPHSIFLSEFSHSYLLNDEKVQNRVLEFLTSN